MLGRGLCHRPCRHRGMPAAATRGTRWRIRKRALERIEGVKPLHHFIVDGHDLEALRTLCFDLGADCDELGRGGCILTHWLFQDHFATLYEGE